MHDLGRLRGANDVPDSNLESALPGFLRRGGLDLSGLIRFVPVRVPHLGELGTYRPVYRPAETPPFVLPGSSLTNTPLRAIPKTRDRDRLLFGLLYTTGMRVGEALAIEVDDLDLSRDDEHVTVLGKGGRRRTVLLDDSTLVALLRRYLKARGYRHGALFRAEKNYVGGPLRYSSVHQLWAKYCAKAQVTATIHQLRHAHATELVNAGVSLETIRRRLGHANAQTVLRYADQRDTTTDAEIRAWRRRKITGRSAG
jgi:integrase